MRRGPVRSTQAAVVQKHGFLTRIRDIVRIDRKDPASQVAAASEVQGIGEVNADGSTDLKIHSTNVAAWHGLV
jgi:hypothetical protein